MESCATRYWENRGAIRVPITLFFVRIILTAKNPADHRILGFNKKENIETVVVK